MRAHLVVLVGLGGLAAQEPAVAFVEVVPASSSAYVQEPVAVVVRIGIDTGFFRASAVPLFQQALDQPFHVAVPWLFGAEDRAVEPMAPPKDAPTQRIAVGDAVVACRVAAPVQRDGRAFSVFELHYRWLPLAAGTSTIAPVEVRYAFAGNFREDFLRGRQPLDRQERTVRSPAQSLLVKALPAAGRPPQWNGAVGEFTVTASTAARNVAVGGSFALEVAVAGAGNLDRMPPMPWPTLPGFHVQGLIERRALGVRTFVFDVLALRHGATEVPAVAFAAFSPARGAYVVQSAGPVPIVVGPPVLPLPQRVRELVDADAAARHGGLLKRWWWLPVAVALAAMLAVATTRRRRRRATARAAALAVVSADDPDAALRAFEALCAACAGAPVFAAGTLAAIGDEALRARATAVHTALDAARFGGVGVPRDELRAVADALRAAVDRRAP